MDAVTHDHALEPPCAPEKLAMFLEATYGPKAEIEAARRADPAQTKHGAEISRLWAAVLTLLRSKHHAKAHTGESACSS